MDTGFHPAADPAVCHEYFLMVKIAGSNYLSESAGKGVCGNENG